MVAIQSNLTGLNYSREYQMLVEALSELLDYLWQDGWNGE